MKYFVLGGTGKMGRIAVRDLLESNKKNEVFIGGRDKSSIQDIIKKYKSRAKFVYIDLTNINETANSIKRSGAKVVLNCAQYYFNIEAMKACLKANANYLDLGGLYWKTKEQLKLNKDFIKAGLTAILGMGSMPGLGNVLAGYGAKKLDTINTINIGFGWTDLNKSTAFFPPYSISSILDEFTISPPILENGKIKRRKPLSQEDIMEFKKPIGPLTTHCIIHSELATFPVSFRDKRLKNLCFKAGFPKDFEDKIKFLISIGLASEKPLDIKGVKIKPRDVLVKVIDNLPIPKDRAKELEDLKVELIGKKNGKKKIVELDCIVKSKKGWEEFGSDIDTGMPISITAQMIAKNLIRESGVLPPEIVIDPKIFFRELKKRGMKIFYNNRKI